MDRLLETADQCFIGHVVYFYSISNFANPTALIQGSTTWWAHVSLSLSVITHPIACRSFIVCLHDFARWFPMLSVRSEISCNKHLGYVDYVRMDFESLTRTYLGCRWRHCQSVSTVQLSLPISIISTGLQNIFSYFGFRVWRCQFSNSMFALPILIQLQSVNETSGSRPSL